MGGIRRHYLGCTCCSRKFDVLAYNLDGVVVRRQYHGHGGYNLEEGIKPGMKISVSADQNMVVCASDTNLSYMSASTSGEATRLFEGWISSAKLFPYNAICLAGLAEGKLARARWRISKKSHSGDWWASCTSILDLFGSPTFYYRAWKLTNGGSLQAMPLNVPFGYLDGDAESDFFAAYGPEYPTGNYWSGGVGESYAPRFFVDGTVPQSVIGGEQVWCAPMGTNPLSDAHAGLFGFNGVTPPSATRAPPANSSDEIRADLYYRGGAQFYHDGRFAWCNRFVTEDDMPVFGWSNSSDKLSITVSLSTFTDRIPTSTPTTFKDAAARYYDASDSSFKSVDTQIGCVDSDQHWHGVKWFPPSPGSGGGIDLGWPFGKFRQKLGPSIYREFDFTVQHELAGGTDWPELIRSVDSPFGSVLVSGSYLPAIPKDIFVQDGFLYCLLPDETDPYYWRRLVKVDLSDFSVVWTKTPPEDWQCYHSITLDGDKLWCAVSASDGSVFEDPTE